jgi:hypothetical protein
VSGQTIWKWRNTRTVAAMTTACWLVASAADSQFTPFSDHRSTLLEGNWQSCREHDGQYSERVFEGRFPGVPPFELHLGPYHEFGLFAGIREAHREHAGADNLLRPYTVEVVAATSARQRWQAGGLDFEVALAGGSRDECESWFITLKRLDSSSSR